MYSPSQRDIVLIPFPFSDQLGIKPRPVIVLSNNEYNKKFRDFIVIPLSGQKLGSRDYIVRVTNNELEQGKLYDDSFAKVDKITCLHQKNIIHKIGKIKLHTFNQLKEILLQVI